MTAIRIDCTIETTNRRNTHGKLKSIASSGTVVQHITKTTPDLILGTLQHADLEMAQQLSHEMQRRGLTTQDILRLKNRKQPVSTT